MIRIYYDGQSLEISEKEKFFLSLTSADLSNLATRSDAYSNTYELLATKNNLKVFNLIALTTGNTDAAFAVKPSQIYDNNTLLLDGYGRVVEVDTNVIRLEITGGIGGLADLFGDTLLPDLYYAKDYVSVDDNYFLPVQISEVPMGADNTKWIRFPFFNNGSFKSISIGLNNRDNFISSSYFPPCFTIYGILNKMITGIGYSMADVQDLTYLNDEVITGNPSHGYQEFIDEGYTNVTNNSILTYRAAAVVVGTINAFINTYTPYVPDVYSASGSWDSLNSWWKLPRYGVKMVTVSWRFKVFDKVDRFYEGPWDNNLYAWIVIGGVRRHAIRANNEDMLEGSIELVADGQEIQFVFVNATVRGVTSSSAPLRRQGFSLDANTLETDYYFRITPIDKWIAGGDVTGRCLPKIKAIDFIADVCNRFGLLLSINEGNRQFAFKPINNLELTPKTDWTDLLGSEDDATVLGQGRSEFSYGSLAKKNWFRNANDLGADYIASDVFGVADEADVYTSPFSIGELKPSKLGVVATLDLVEITSSDPSGLILVYNPLSSYDPNAVIYYKGLYYKSTASVLVGEKPATFPDEYIYYPNDPPNPLTNKWEPLNTEEVYKANDTIGIARIGFKGDITSPVNFQIINNSNQVVAIPLIVQTLNFLPMHWDKLLTANQAVVRRMLKRPRLDRLLIKLNTSDITNIDFSRAVTVNGVAYYINLIDQFDVINKGLVPCELLQIPPK